jgi:hypothetical protein
MKAVYTVVILTLVLAAAAFSQSYTWQHMGVFPPSKGAAGDTLFGADCHGIATSPDGKIWVQLYGVRTVDSLLIPNYMADKDTAGGVDSIEARKITVRALYCFNPDGTQPSWSPIKVTNVNGKNDTLGGASVYVKGKLVWHPSISVNTGRGLRTAPDGNIVAVYFNYVYTFNYKTGACISKITALPSRNASLVAPGVDTDGNIYINMVSAGGTPLAVYDKTGAFLQNARDTLQGFSRATIASSDGNDIYYAGYTLHTVIRYRNSSGSGVLGPWDKIDSVMKGFDCESMTWNAKTKMLWASSGSYNDNPNRYPGVTTTYDTAAWYPYNPTTSQVLTNERILWTFGTARNAGERPRAIGFSVSGDSAYVGVFGGALPTPGVRWYVRKLTSVEPVESGIPGAFTLSQNYPNPFNPSTEISFTITKSGMTTLRVFDVLGKEVRTLVNEELVPGTYKSKLDASNLASGTYIYMLTSNGQRLVNKMMLLK